MLNGSLCGLRTTSADVHDFWSQLTCSNCAGIRIFCTEERSQGKNREIALTLLRSKLYELELEKQQSEIAAKRRSQVSLFYV